jgi:hypothetical protein
VVGLLGGELLKLLAVWMWGKKNFWCGGGVGGPCARVEMPKSQPTYQ